MTLTTAVVTGLLLRLARPCLALDSTAATAVPSGIPIAGDYGGPHRPQLHFSPPQHFMNDPNGLFRDDDGVWHLYYQYNPTDVVAGNQHWGHATSPDLYHWVNQPIALFPPRTDVFVFSGSVVVDANNTSGFFPSQTNGVVAVYTLAEYHADGSPGSQTQAVAYSRDGGYSFTAYRGNPVIPSNSSQFRDPKVVWYEDHWVMAVAYPHDYAVGIFTSPNLIDWTPRSNFSHHGLLGLQWECPNLVRMPHVDEKGDKRDGMWLMVVSVNPGAPLGGSVAQYYPGTFNGSHFQPVDSAARIADFGKDNYAGQFFYGLADDEDPVWMAWASNWQYAQAVPTAQEGWRSAMSLPRRAHLAQTERAGWKLVTTPYDLSPVKGEVLASSGDLANGTLTLDFDHVPSNALYWEANATGIPNTALSATATLNFTFSSPQTGESLRGGFFFGGDSAFFLDRGGARGFRDVFFTDKMSTSSPRSGSRWDMSGVIDRSVLEVFLNRGVDSATTSFFTEQPLTRLELRTGDLPEGMRVSVRVHALRSVWRAADDGLVYGNQSSTDGGAQGSWQMLGIM